MILNDRRLASDLGHETLDILRRRRYAPPVGGAVELGGVMDACVRSTVEYPTGTEPPEARESGCETVITVENNTVLEVGRRMARAGPVAALNFASATDPGGGFVGRAIGQEESLARSSCLYAALKDRGMYPYHRARLDAMYSDWVIFSSAVPVFRDDRGELLDEPWLLSVITCPAVHANGVRRYTPARESEIPDVMRRRTTKVLAVAAAHGVRRLILGAWGCGACGGDPKLIAHLFREALAGAFAGVFEEVVFAITDTSPDHHVIGPFQGAFAANAPSRDRCSGALIGLAVGDALGTTLEFKPRGTFEPVEDRIGGGPFDLQPGQWTDDTSMALCLAESLLEQNGFDPHDQMRRYVRWWREGYWSSTGRCFDIGSTVRAALEEFERTGRAFAGSTDPRRAGNGSLMRLAPVALYHAQDPIAAVAFAGESSRTTHGASEAVDACRYFAALLVGALRGEAKEVLLGDHYAPPGIDWHARPLSPAIAAIARGSFKRKTVRDIRASGYVVHTLEAALWAFYSAEDFRRGALLAVNLGDDADTTGAVYGQLAGAYYGLAGIPTDWRDRLARVAEVEGLAARLFKLAER